MISWVAMDRIVERQRAADAAYRKQAAGKVLRSDAKRFTDGELLAGVRFDHGAAYTQSIVISTYTGTLRTSDCTYMFTPRLSELSSREGSASEVQA